MSYRNAFNKDKFKAMIHYIVSKCGHKRNFGRTVLYKLLYFSEFNYFELYENFIAHEDYEKYPRGPVPKHFFEAKEELIFENKIEEIEHQIDSKRKQYSMVSLTEPNAKDLLNIEKEVIDDVINKIGNMNASEISEYSHRDMPWMATEDYDIIDYGFVFYRDEEYTVRDYDI
ncbi:MAG: Panacea domain-containing protein [Methanobrevibacter sp.]|uniref:Panacea domain-containing protein n=1 Tax=Methanobrevibacter sp. TaxID=66852 RepID=UPI0026DF046B|nr:Panacea domain-containing protein [Methanobrevibacter sp.]MDO5848838.1 Panacea domain-containing protein [Methanobrevibacter sp.]